MKQLTSLHKISVSLFLFFLFTVGSASDPRFSGAGAREAGMGYACVMNSDFWSSFSNPAGFALNNELMAGINYEDRFGIKELGVKSAAIIFPSGKRSVGFFYSNNGYSDLNYHTTGIATGLKISDIVTAGIEIEYIAESKQGSYKDNSAVTFSTGILIIPTGKLRIGIRLFNPVPNSFRTNYMPSDISIGTEYSISKTVRIGVEIEKSTENPLLFKTGFECEPLNKLYLRGGFNSRNSTLSFGIGFRTKSVTTDIAFVTHQHLGITPSLSLIIKL